ncbi:MAG: hypothetical protein AAB303_02100, partial [Chloroflexota bacterium]
MMYRPPKRRKLPKEMLLLVAAAILTAVNLVVLGNPFGPTSALLTDAPSIGGNVLSTKADWEAPVTSSARVLNSIGYVDYLKQG